MNAPSHVIPKRLLVVEDHPVVRYGLTQFLGRLPEVALCGEAENAQQALEAMRRLQPQVVLMDVSMPGTDGIETTKLMLAEQPRLIILLISMHDESLYALRALRAGAKGYVMKQQSMEDLFAALRKVIGGGLYVSPRFSERLVFRAIQGSECDLGSAVDKLSDRELEVLQLFGSGHTTREVAGALHLSAKTIETHRTHIKGKLGFQRADELMKFAAEWKVAVER